MSDEPILVVSISKAGVIDSKILYRTISEQAAGQKLLERCAPLIALLSRAARGVSVPTPNSPIELPEAPVTHATSQTHHPRS